MAGTAEPAARTGGGAQRRTPGEHLAADAFAMKRLSVRLHARLLELVELKGALTALSITLEQRLAEKESDARAE